MKQILDTQRMLKHGLAVINLVSQHVRTLLHEKVNLHTYMDKTNVSGDRVSVFDEKVNEKAMDIIKGLKDLHPLLLISEETGVEVIGRGEPCYFMILDPVDGSNNIRPFFTPAPNISISLGLGYMEDLLARPNPGALRISVHKEIFADKVYYAVSGQGAFFKEKNLILPIKASPVDALRPKAIIGMDLDNRKDLPKELQMLLCSQIVQRRLGSSHLDFCQVASGQYDAYISDSGRLKVTDICQSYHIVKAAGGIFAYQLLLDGQAAADYQEGFLLKVRDDQSLLGRLKFRVVAAGSHGFFEELRGALWR